MRSKGFGCPTEGGVYHTILPGCESGGSEGYRSRRMYREFAEHKEVPDQEHELLKLEMKRLQIRELELRV